MNNFKQHLKQILQADQRLWSFDDETELNQTLLIDLAEHYDENVLSLLFADELCKNKFFIKVGEYYVFKSNDFQFFLEENKVDNSYTKYKNRIGLSDGKRFLKDTKDVVLNFPFKDGILEGGQSTEEGQDKHYKNVGTGYQPVHLKRKEIFFNEVLAADEIDRLTDEKALVNFKRFSKDVGIEHCSVRTDTKINRDQNGTIKDNLIIKGNNYLALHSLKKQFTGKVKLIYIDPPYNTGGDANIFTYNNNFNHSTWLTFMKNRLEIGKQLLRDDGFIAIAIDHCELFYLGTLADEIFGRDNRLGIITVVHKPEGRQFSKGVNPTNEFMLWYSKNKHHSKLSTIPIDKEKLSDFNEEDENGKFKWIDYIRLGGGDANLRTNKEENWYPVYVSKNLSYISLEKRDDYYEIFPITDKGIERTWNNSKNKFLEDINFGNIKVVKQNNNLKILRKLRANQMIKTHWDKAKYNATRYGTQELNKLIGIGRFSYPKSLYTVLDTLKIMTNKDDIILDFHAGSGTTGHAVLALNKEDGGNRKFILVEQLDEHIDICIERNQKVLQKENIDDSFIYCELAKWNEQAKEYILTCESLEELKTFFDEMVEKYFLNYNLKIKEFQDKVLQEEEFKKLLLQEQKQMFCTMLDNNQMYVCRSEMDDAKFGISERDREMTKEFYRK